MHAARAGSKQDVGARLNVGALVHPSWGIVLHGLDIAHQDLKPSNVLPIAGDPTYAPPELLYNYVPADWNVRRYACDVYLLGANI